MLTCCSCVLHRARVFSVNIFFNSQTLQQTDGTLCQGLHNHLWLRIRRARHLSETSAYLLEALDTLRVTVCMRAR